MQVGGLKANIVAKWIDTRSQPTKVLDSVVIPAKDIRTGCPDAPSDGFVSHGSYIVLGVLFLSLMARRLFYVCHDDIRRQHGHRHPHWRLSETVSEKACHVCFMRSPDKDDPDDNACHVSLFRCNLVLKNVFKEESCFICPSCDAHEKSTDKLSDVVSTEKAEQRYRHLLQGTIQRGAPVPPAGRCSWNSSISPRFHPSSFIQYHPGADGMQHHQYAVQPRPHAAGVTELPDSTKGGAKGHDEREAHQLAESTILVYLIRGVGWSSGIF
ncbi:hypothetical protein CK203_049939 [Vitis vinifera]|uniref:Uncharacterized protein n=1 Tax=Vitis vinifera TaxID=29760 RepID=A0A438GRV0_VITVI|nr:hypothetical protein CK203_049939 [Vitis vinifera]